MYPSNVARSRGGTAAHCCARAADLFQWRLRGGTSITPAWNNVASAPCNLVVTGRARIGWSGCSRWVAASSCSRPASSCALVSRSGGTPASAATFATAHHCSSADLGSNPSSAAT